MADMATTGPAFIEIAHRIVWCTVATVDEAGRPRTRVLHPIWEFVDGVLMGWIATSPLSPKATHLDANPAISLTYWDPSHDVATADCTTRWITDDEGRHAGWDRFVDGPAPVGYDPSIIPAWTDADNPAFGVLELAPTHLRVFPGSMLMTGQGEVLTWSA